MKSKIIKVIKCLKDSDYRTEICIRYGLYNGLSDKTYIKKEFKSRMGYNLDLKNPKTYNEKIQWLKLFDRKDVYTTMVDKYKVKEYVANKIGAEYIICTYGVWERFEDIEFDSLPDAFVLKCTHDSGGLVICKDKKNFNKQTAKKQLEKSIKRNYYLLHREWPYKNVKRCIIAEEYMENTDGTELSDYKFYCFNGEPKFLYVSSGMENHATASISFLTLDWKFAPYKRSDYKAFKELPTRPKNFELMLELAKRLSEGIDFLRVDLYEINGKVYFSELTFSPCAGYMPFENPEHDLFIGKMLTLTKY